MNRRQVRDESFRKVYRPQLSIRAVEICISDFAQPILTNSLTRHLEYAMSPPTFRPKLQPMPVGTSRPHADSTMLAQILPHNTLTRISGSRNRRGPFRQVPWNQNLGSHTSPVSRHGLLTSVLTTSRREHTSYFLLGTPEAEWAGAVLPHLYGSILAPCRIELTIGREANAPDRAVMALMNILIDISLSQYQKVLLATYQVPARCHSCTPSPRCP